MELRYPDLMCRFNAGLSFILDAILFCLGPIVHIGETRLVNENSGGFHWLSSVVILDSYMVCLQPQWSFCDAQWSAIHVGVSVSGFPGQFVSAAPCFFFMVPRRFLMVLVDTGRTCCGTGREKHVYYAFNPYASDANWTRRRMKDMIYQMSKTRTHTCVYMQIHSLARFVLNILMSVRLCTHAHGSNPKVEVLEVPQFQNHFVPFPTFMRSQLQVPVQWHPIIRDVKKGGRLVGSWQLTPGWLKA